MRVFVSLCKVINWTSSDKPVIEPLEDSERYRFGSKKKALRWIREQDLNLAEDFKSERISEADSIQLGVYGIFRVGLY